MSKASNPKMLIYMLYKSVICISSVIPSEKKHDLLLQSLSNNKSHVKYNNITSLHINKKNDINVNIYMHEALIISIISLEL